MSGVFPNRLAFRGFALPMVILLAMVVGILAAVMLERQGAQRLSAERVAASYREHHVGRGVREVISSWLVSLSGQPVEGMIAPDGRVLDIGMGNGSSVRIFMEDGQGSALVDLSAVSGEELEVCRNLRDRLEEVSRGRPDPKWVRRVGPARISARSAPEEVIEALAFVIGKNKVKATSFARAVREARRDGVLTDGDIAAAADGAALSPEARALISRMLAASPDLWLVRVEVVEPGRAGSRATVSARYEGRVLLGGTGASSLGSNLSQSMGSFLSWEERPVE
jgi:hypothetical protein